MSMLEAIEQRAGAQGVPVDARIERGRSYRHALARLLEHETFDRVVVSATANGGDGPLRRRPRLAAAQGAGRGADPAARARRSTRSPGSTQLTGGAGASPIRSAPAASSIAPRAVRLIAVSLAKPWIRPGWRRRATWTPAARIRSA